MQIGARIARAGWTKAIGIKLLLREFVNTAPQLQKAARRKGTTTLRDLRRDDAIKHINAAMHRFENVEGRADAHQVAWLVLWQQIGRKCADVFALIFLFADGKASNGETIERHRAKSIHTFPA